MNETFYNRWIQDCVDSPKAGETREALLEHIQKHAGPDLMKRVNSGDDADWSGWVASMYNILAIFELKTLGRKVTVEEKLFKMHHGFSKNQDTFQPPPSDVITKEPD